MLHHTPLLITDARTLGTEKDTGSGAVARSRGHCGEKPHLCALSCSSILLSHTLLLILLQFPCLLFSRPCSARRVERKAAESPQGVRAALQAGVGSQVLCPLSRSLEHHSPTPTPAAPCQEAAQRAPLMQEGWGKSLRWSLQCR